MDTKKLRQKILDLAIHGKLVPQDPNDEPASVLLERIRAEKEALIKEGKIKRAKKATASDTSHYENVPFEVPDGWCWCKVTEALTKLTDGTHHSPISTPEGDFKYITAKNIKPWGIDLEDITYVDKVTHDEIYARCNPEIGDILYIKDGATTGVVCINDLNEPFSLLSSVALLKPSKQISNRFLLAYLQSSICYDSVRESMKGVGITRITLKIIENWDIPLPPYNEQVKIADSVEFWLHEIDKIETNCCNIKQYVCSLKSKILDFAIHGKLVPQNPNDEPASELLKRINPKAVSSCDNPQYQKPYDIPKGWTWCKLLDICSFLSRGKSPVYSETDRTYPVFAQKCNLKEGGISLEKAQFLDPTTLKRWPEEYKLKTGDILVNSTGTGTVGRTRLFDSSYLGDYPFVVPDSHVSVIRTYDDIDSGFIFSIMSSPWIQSYLEDNLAGSTNQKELYISVLQNIDIPLPPINEQSKIALKVSELFKGLEKIQTELEA